MVKHSFRRSFIITAVFSLAFIYVLFFRNHTVHIASQGFLTMGTWVSIKVAHSDKEEAYNAIKAAEQSLLQFDENWHALDGKILGDINQQLAQRDYADLPLDAYNLLKEAQILSQQSNGLFDPAVGRLLQLWDFYNEERVSSSPPHAEQIEQWLNTKQAFSEVTLTTTQLAAKRGTQIDLGAFAKGIAVGNAVNVLKQYGVKNAIVDGGGDLQAIGTKAGKKWRIGVRQPRGEFNQHLAIIEMNDGDSLFTSGDYERFFTDPNTGEQYHHILDPRSGYPSKGLISVTVLADSPGLADAASTALFVAGKQDWQQIAKQMNINKVLLVTDTGEVIITSVLQEQTVLNDEIKPTVVNF